MKIGDVVQLKSGGSKMTVSFVNTASNGAEEVNCVFFDGAGELDRQTFLVDCLTIISSRKRKAVSRFVSG